LKFTTGAFLMTKFHSIRAISSQLGLSVSTVWRYIQDGRLPAFKIGGYTWRVSDDALQHFINGSEYDIDLRGHTAAESINPDYKGS
jgi:excisionase family DNA binding protein